MTRDQVRGASATRVQQALTALGLDFRVREFPQSTRTARQAADAIGCTVAQIAKSIVFRTTLTRQPVLVIASGENRIDERKVAALVGEPIEKADAEFVRATTGYAIGGVPPFGHPAPLRTLLDQDLMVYDQIWAAAGTPNAVFALTPAVLPDLLGQQAVDVALSDASSPPAQSG